MKPKVHEHQKNNFKKLIVLLLIFTATITQAQVTTDNRSYSLKEVDEAPAPQGTGFTEYFKKNFHSIEKPTTPLKLSFLVEKGGVVHDIKVFGEVSETISKEAIRVVKASKKWKPGKKNGKAVRVLYTANINL